MESTDRINCVFSTDNNYCQHLAVTLMSLLENNAANDIAIFIIHDGVSETNLASLSAMLEKFPGLPVTFYAFDAAAYAHFRVDHYITLATYFRLFLTDILPAKVSRAIYLDADLLVLGDIRPLWELDLGDKLIAAAPDLFMPNNSRLGLPEKYCYFNAGVLLIDLAGWRSQNLQSVFVNFIETSSAILKHHDQDALNVILQDKVFYLDFTWNFQPRSNPEDVAQIGVSREGYFAVKKSPKIVHFTSGSKPWLYRFDVAFEDRYLHYLRKTPWKNYIPPDRTFARITWRLIKRRLPWPARAVRAIFQTTS